MKASIRSNQTSLGDRAPAFDRDEATARRARQLCEVVADALKRRGDGTWEGVAPLLDRAFGEDGRPVAASTLRVAFKQAERNYPRLEWLALVLDDEEVQAFLRPPAKSPAEELAELREHLAKRAPDTLEAFDRRRGRP